MARESLSLWSCPQQNAYVERYNRTVRYEWLAQYLFDSIEELQEFATNWLWAYNHERPNMALGGITPALQFNVRDLHIKDKKWTQPSR